MPENPLEVESVTIHPSADAAPVVVAAPVRRGKVTCEFCKCELTPQGEILEFSEDARAYRDAKERNRKEVAELTEQVAILRREKESLTAQTNSTIVPGVRKRKGLFNL